MRFYRTLKNIAIADSGMPGCSKEYNSVSCWARHDAPPRFFLSAVPVVASTAPIFVAFMAYCGMIFLPLFERSKPS
jgi:hypothetical protein